MLPSSKNVKYPRDKNFIHNLNELFPSNYPSQAVQQSFMPLFSRSASARPSNTQRSNRVRSPDKNSLANKKQSLPSSAIQTFNSFKSVQSEMQKSKQLRKQKMKEILSIGNMRRTLSNNRKILTTQTYRKKLPSSEGKDKQRESYSKFGNMKVDSALFAQQQKQQINKMRYPSSGVLTRRQEPQHYDYNASNKRQKKEYLKKGSGINKGVLNTIIKLKLTKNSPEDNLQSSIKNQDILNMIKVYKGTVAYSPQKQCLQDKKGEKPLIIGWENETQQYNIE